MSPAVETFLREMVSDRTAREAAGLVGTAGEVLWEEATGAAARFDYASLTKPFMATLGLLLDRDGTLPLRSRIGAVWPRAHRELKRRAVEDLFRHRAGLVGWTPLYSRCRSLDEVRELILSGGLLGARSGTYSDLGYILLALTLERVTGRPLFDLLRERVLAPLGLSQVAAPGPLASLAPSPMGTTKEVFLASRLGLSISDLGPPPAGLPQDGNARFLVNLGMPVTGHAGLFGDARSLWRLAAEWLAPGSLLHPAEVSRALAGRGRFALGWWRRAVRGSAGPALSSGSFGHTGFAGGSLWIDPERGAVFTLLSSRLDPMDDMNRTRRRFHELAADFFAMEAAS